MSVVRLTRLLCVASLTALAATGPLAAPDAAAQTTAAPHSRVVMQVSDNDPAKWNLALNNARNLQSDLGAANVEIEIVAYGPGIGMLKAESVVGNRIGEALDSGVKVAACENTMRGQKLGEAGHAERHRLRSGRRGRDRAEAAAGLGVPAALRSNRGGESRRARARWSG